MRRSAARTEVACRGDVARVGGDAGQGVEGEHLDVGVVVASGVVEDRDEPFLGAGRSDRRRPWRRAGTRRARPARRRRRRGATPPPLRAPSALARSVRAHAGRARDGPGRARPGARRRWPRPCRSRAPGWRRRRRSRRPGTALVRGWTSWYASVCRKPRRREVSAARPMWTTASSNRCWMRASSPSIASRRTCSHGSSTVRSQCWTWSTRVDAALLVAGGDRGSGGEEPVRGLVPRPVQPVVERVAAIGQLQRLAELAVVGHDVGEVVRSSAPAGRRRRSRRPARWPRRCGRGPARGDRSTLRSTPRAAGRWPGPRAGAASPAASSAARIRWAPRLSPRTTQAQPNPLTMPSASSGSCAALQARAASMLARSARAKARCSAWRLLRTPVRGGSRPRRRTTRRARRGRARTARRRSSLRARTRGCCRAAGSGPAPTRRRRRRSPASGWRAGRPRRSRRRPARRALRGRTRPRRAVRHRRTWPAPTGPAGRRGTTGRSSIGSST